MTNPYRALCAELNFIWGRSTNPDDLFENMIPLIDRARALLAEPEPSEPTAEELYELWVQNRFEIDRFAHAILARDLEKTN